MDFITQLNQVSLDPALRAWITSQLVELENKQVALKNSQSELKNIQIKNQALTLELAYLKRLKYGVKTEALSSVQRELFAESYEEDAAAITAQLESLAPPAPRTPAKPSGRKALPPELPRIEHRHEPETCTCGQCGQSLVKIGEDISEQLDVEPARFFVHHHIRPQYACRHCETVSAAPIPPALIDGGLGSPGLYAWVLTQKYLDHLPLYRIEQISTRYGVSLARSTLAEWVGQMGVALQPLADRLAVLLKQRPVLHADETPVPLLNPGTGKTKRAYLWAYGSNPLDQGPPMIVFDFQANRSGQHARHFLEGWQGHLMVDDYSGYKALFQGGDIHEMACLAHIRRKFFDLHAANGHPVAAQALAEIAELYRIEHLGKDLSIEARQKLRQEKARPRLEAWHLWLLAQRSQTAPGSALMKAIDYALKRWVALLRYTDHGDLPIDNNRIENAIRPIALGRKNWLFVGSERAGQRAAAIQSLLATAKANHIEPMAWLKHTLEKLPSCPYSQIDSLLPLPQQQ
jgi:transposase